MKAATIIAPFLLIGGYIVADYYQTAREEELRSTQAKKIEAFELDKVSACGLLDEPCKFEKDGLVLTMSADDNSYHIDSNQGLEGVTIGLAQSDRETRTLQMQQISEPTHWAIPIRRLTNLKGNVPLTMRLAVASNGKRYYVEFQIDPTGPWSVD
ncbi:MAG: hypothetical protein U9N50_11560 [Pseudomonadota bacterium]|nr:hypothetical protein [Pseudomonadota bacterium]